MIQSDRLLQYPNIPGNTYLILFGLVLIAQRCECHGRLIEPPSRASAWRYGFNTPPDYNDHELYCGGFTRQWKINSGKCGECGDAWDLPEPRPHEFGGQWGQGLIVRKYAVSSEILIRVELTASHMGYFEFRICPEPNAKQICLDRYKMNIISGNPAQPAPSDLNTRFYPRNGSRVYEIKAELPLDLKCSQCVLQWRYIAGNNWGLCQDGNGAVGCGPQEEFRACADIALGDEPYPTIRPFRPTLHTSMRPKTAQNDTEYTETESEIGNNYNSLYILLLICFLLCALIAWYLHRYKNEKIKRFYAKLCEILKKNAPIVSTNKRILDVAPGLNTLVKVSPDDLHPVPPPRVKRQLRMAELSPNESSIA